MGTPVGSLLFMKPPTWPIWDAEIHSIQSFNPPASQNSRTSKMNILLKTKMPRNHKVPVHFQKGTTKSCWHVCCSPYCTAFLFRTHQVVFCYQKKIRHPETIPRAVPPDHSTSMGASWKPMTSSLRQKEQPSANPKMPFLPNKKNARLSLEIYSGSKLFEQNTCEGWWMTYRDDLTKIVQDKALKCSSNCDGSLYWHQ